MTRFSRLAANATLVMLVAACGRIGVQGNEDSPTQNDVPGQFPSSLAIQRAYSFDEASRLVGYQIPHTTEYELVRDTIYVQGTRERPVRVIMLYSVSREGQIDMRVVRDVDWRARLSARDATTLAGTQGYMVDRDDEFFEFVFVCGEVDDVICSLRSTGVSIEELEYFVSTVKS